MASRHLCWRDLQIHHRIVVVFHDSALLFRCANLVLVCLNFIGWPVPKWNFLREMQKTGPRRSGNRKWSCWPDLNWRPHPYQIVLNVIMLHLFALKGRFYL